jgi:hypothetical protein
VPLTPAEKQQRYRDRQRELGKGGIVTEEPVTVTEEGVTEERIIPPATGVPRPTNLRGLIAAARAGTLTLSEREEQAIRRHFGYASSEKRTLLQRDEAARRIPHQVDVEVVETDGTVRRFDPDGEPVKEAAGHLGLSLIAYPTQVEGDLTPAPEARAKLG